MGWYLRKSISVGPIRLNLSKSGLGLSAGIRGARVGIRPDGRTYVHGGRYGVYYRHDLGGDEPQSATAPGAAAGYRESAPLAHLSRQEGPPWVRLLNDAMRQPRADVLAGLSLFVLALAVAVRWGAWAIPVALLSAGVVLGLNIWQGRRRAVAVLYDLEAGALSAFRHVVEAVNLLTTCSRIEAVDRNGNALRAQIGTGAPPWLQTNVPIPTVAAGARSFGFLPDGVLIWESSEAVFVPYRSLHIGTVRTQRPDADPASDARIVGARWLHERVDGAPDRRFRENLQLHVCEVGCIELRFRYKVLLSLVASNPEIAEKFEAGIERAVHELFLVDAMANPEVAEMLRRADAHPAIARILAERGFGWKGRLFAGYLEGQLILVRKALRELRTFDPPPASNPRMEDYRNVVADFMDRMLNILRSLSLASNEATADVFAEGLSPQEVQERTRQATARIGALCRMVVAWERELLALPHGVEQARFRNTVRDAAATLLKEMLELPGSIRRAVNASGSAHDGEIRVNVKFAVPEGFAERMQQALS